jgi:hypothetical protein
MKTWLICGLLAVLAQAGFDTEPEMRQMKSCFAKPEACFAAFCYKAYGWNERKETVWQFLLRNTKGCENILEPLVARPPAADFYLNEDNGARVLSCMKQMKNVADPGPRAVVDEFRSRSEALRQKRRKDRRAVHQQARARSKRDEL